MYRPKNLEKNIEKFNLLNGLVFGINTGLNVIGNAKKYSKDFMFAQVEKRSKSKNTVKNKGKNSVKSLSQNKEMRAKSRPMAKIKNAQDKENSSCLSFNLNKNTFSVISRSVLSSKANFIDKESGAENKGIGAQRKMGKNVSDGKRSESRGSSNVNRSSNNSHLNTINNTRKSPFRKVNQSELFKKLNRNYSTFGKNNVLNTVTYGNNSTLSNATKNTNKNSQNSKMKQNYPHNHSNAAVKTKQRARTPTLINSSKLSKTTNYKSKSSIINSLSHISNIKNYTFKSKDIFFNFKQKKKGKSSLIFNEEVLNQQKLNMSTNNNIHKNNNNNSNSNSNTIYNYNNNNQHINNINNNNSNNHIKNINNSKRNNSNNNSNNNNNIRNRSKILLRNQGTNFGKNTYKIHNKTMNNFNNRYKNNMFNFKEILLGQTKRSINSSSNNNINIKELTIQNISINNNGLLDGNNKSRNLSDNVLDKVYENVDNIQENNIRCNNRDNDNVMNTGNKCNLLEKESNKDTVTADSNNIRIDRTDKNNTAEQITNSEKVNSIHIINNNPPSLLANIFPSPQKPASIPTPKLPYTKRIKCMHDISKTGLNGDEKKVNQDNFFIYKNFGNCLDNIYMGVCDGHGFFGHEISGYLRENLPMDLNHVIKTRKIDVQNDSFDKVCEAVNYAYVTENNTLLRNKMIDSNLSGSTCVSIIYTPIKMYVINVGDSRCILGKLNKTTSKFECEVLSNDHKPSVQEEAERIKKKGGRIRPMMDEEGNFVGPLRVYMKDKDMPGLAMTRSFGDYFAYTAGTIPDPEISEHIFSEEDKFLILASDGLFEFMTNEEIVEIVKEYYKENEIVNCCEFLYKESSRRWLREEEDTIDDITIIVVFFE